MKRRLLYSILVSLLVNGNLVFAAEGVGPVSTVIQFYKASKNGDIETMKRFISGSFYNRRKVLLEENKEYPNFLRQHYQGTKIRVVNSNITKDNAVVDISIEFPDGSIDVNSLLLKKDASGIWRIVDEKMSQ
ncbi:MAG: hypothetical protein C4291_00690 [Candidatus Dadabacteria bacterium]